MIKSIIGGILIAFGVFLSLGFVINATQEGINAGDIAAILMLGIAPIAGGGVLIRSHFKRKRNVLLDQKKALQAKQETEIFRLAQQKGGRLSIPDIVAGTSLSTIEVDQIMRTMAENGYVSMEVTNSGIIIYEFYEIAHRNELEE
jgi:hypothetical protein